eukprot:364496-Chlamydomonas_euryale.AAC.4
MVAWPCHGAAACVGARATKCTWLRRCHGVSYTVGRVRLGGSAGLRGRVPMRAVRRSQRPRTTAPPGAFSCSNVHTNRSTLPTT